MILYGKVINEETGMCEVGVGTNIDFYKSIGYVELDVKQSDIDGCYYLAKQCPMKTDEEKAKEEAERIAKLHLTGADVERGIYQAKGLDFDDIVAMVEAQAPDKVKPLKIELKANNFYRGNPYVEEVGKLLGFTSKQLDEFFETNDYTKLLPEEKPNADTTDTTEPTIKQDEVPAEGN